VPDRPDGGDPTPIAREELLADDLRALFRRHDPVPAEIVAAARAAGPARPAGDDVP
jgi:hypothetical protein